MISYEQALSGDHDFALREAEALYEGRGRLRRTYDRLSKRLKDMGIAHSLVDGFAVFLHGLRRFTEDIDVLVAPSNIAVLRDGLIGRGYMAVPGSGTSLRDADTGVRIDFVLSGGYPGDGKPKAVVFPAPDADCETRGGLLVVGLRTLIELKLASGMTGAGRLQDLADVQRLIQVHRLTPEFAQKLNGFVRQKFVELCESPEATG